jgi:short-subunit dehydrogenase
MDLRGSVVVVTGASSGIGRATALAFARRGARLVLAARRVDRLQAVADEIALAGSEALAVPCDVGRPSDIDELVRVTMERFGRIDVLVNNAGFGFSGTIEDTPDEVMRELLDVNYLGAFRLTRAVLPLMRKQRSGHIVNVSSVVGKISFPFHGAYSASKFAMCAMTEALRGELSGSGVTATVVLPASTTTEFFDAQQRIGEHSAAPAGPQQTAERVARAIVRSVNHPTPEVNLVAPMRLAYGLNAFFPVLRDLAGRLFYRQRKRGGAAKRDPAEITTRR